MSNATKCDRCGGFFEQGGKNIRKGWGAASKEYDLCPDCAESFDAWLANNTTERVAKTPKMANDTREQLESEVTVYLIDKVCTWGKQRYELRNEVSRWLDRQAAITERECRECEDALREQHHKRIAELRAEYRDEWKGLAEKYRADSIAAQEECERYREKLGDVLDALHEAERAAR